jgi:alkylation response protein AidB-like acyl-CoA dehydrogenase
MDFSIPHQTLELVNRVREFVDSRIVPLELEMLQRSFPENEAALNCLRSEVRALGMWALPIERKHGGAGLGLTDFALVAEQLGRTPFGHYVFNCQAPDIGNMEVLALHGDEAQRDRFLGPLVRGELRSCFAMTEPDYPGSNPVWMGTRARRDGETYVLNGRKWFASSCDGAAFAVIMAVTDPEAEPHRRASMFITALPCAGFELVRNVPVMGEAGRGWASHGEVTLDDCCIPASGLIGEEGAGFAIAQDRLGPGRIHHCMRWIGIGERALELMCRRALGRELRPGGTLAEQQTVRAWIAESRAELDAARLMVLRAAWTIENSGTKAARDLISSIKFFVAGVMQRVLDRAIQAHGALGVTDETPLAFWYRHERAARIYDGPDEVHKETVARRLLARYRSGTAS